MGFGQESSLTSMIVLLLATATMMERATSEVTPQMTVEKTTAQMLMTVPPFTLERCDFHFRGHKSVPLIINLQQPGLNALSSSIISRDGQALKTATVAKQCLFPGVEEEEVVKVGELCAQHFHVELDKLATEAVENITEFDMRSLKGRQVLLPLDTVDLEDGTKLRPGDGNQRFPEDRRCVSFFTASDISSLLDRVLNKAHRKKLAKISSSAERFRYDLNALVNSILQFP